MNIKNFNPSRESHLVLLKYLEKHFDRNKDTINIDNSFNNYQHIFKNGKYFITINWELV